MNNFRHVTALSVAAVLCSSVLAGEAPKFSIVGTDGRTYTQKSFGTKPALVVFLNHECPHSRAATPDLNKLRKLISSGVQVIAVTDLDAKAAKKYGKEIKAEFPILPDPEKKLVKAIGAKFSLDMTVFSGKTKPVFSKVWQGYSQSWVTEALAAAKTSGANVPKANLSFLPKDRQSGCQF